jgi:hypothetical protein
MTEFRPRLFDSDAAVARVGEGLLAASHAGGMDGRAIARPLPREEWTHEAHLAATTYLLLRHPEIDLDKDLAGLISHYNESAGGVNSDSEGYHDTITRVFLHGIRLFLSEVDRREPLHVIVNELLSSPMGKRDWPLRFYTRDRLLSVAARRSFVPPDLGALP